MPHVLIADDELVVDGGVEVLSCLRGAAIDILIRRRKQRPHRIIPLAIIDTIDRTLVGDRR